MTQLRSWEWILVALKPILCMLAWYCLRKKPFLRSIRWFMLVSAFKETGIILLLFCLPVVPYFFFFWSVKFLMHIFICVVGGLLCMDLSPYRRVKPYVFYLPVLGPVFITVKAAMLKHPFQYPDVFSYDILAAVFGFGIVSVGVLFSVHKTFKFQAFALWTLAAGQVVVASFTAIRGYRPATQLTVSALAIAIASVLCSGSSDWRGSQTCVRNPGCPL